MKLRKNYTISILIVCALISSSVCAQHNKHFVAEPVSSSPCIQHDADLQGGALSSSPCVRYDGPILGDPIPLAACTTIDGDDDDKDSRKFLRCAKKALKLAHIPYSSNGPLIKSNNQLKHAFANLAACSNPGTAMVIGHGQSGEVRVGGGDQAIEDDNLRDITHIADILDSHAGVHRNPGIWEPLIEDIRSKFKMVTLLGCQTGATPSGNKLVADFSSAVGSKVRAPMSRVWCDDNYQLRLEKGAGWAEAKDGSAKTGRSPSIKIGSPLGEGPEIIRFPVNELNVYESFAYDRSLPDLLPPVKRCVFKTAYHPASACKTIRSHGQFLSSILFDRPLQPHAVPNAEITGTISITPCLDKNDKKCEPRKFDVLNDDLVADQKTRTYYHVTEAFKTNWYKVD
jgi:hypothetical protein